MTHHAPLQAAVDVPGDQLLRALQSPALAAMIQYRLGHFAKGHDEAADDALTYAAMLANVERHFLHPMRDRTHGNSTAAERAAAARAALKLAALCLAFADKINRDHRNQPED